MKTLSERVLDMASTQNKRASKAQRVFMIYGDEILQALDKGLPKRWIWETLRQEKENCIPRYERFLIHLRRFLKAKRQESTPEENITKAPPTPASAPAPKTAVPTASAPAAGQQMQKPSTQPKSFEYHPLTPEEIKTMMSGEE